MNLLPRSRDEFRSTQYWDQFFKRRGKDGTFEWYGEYNDLCGVLHKYCRSKHRLLVVGCGNSRLSEDLYDVGYRSMVNVDISEVVIRQMTERNQQRRPEMEFMRMDMRSMSFENGQFDVVLDKGTLDAIMSSDSEEVARDTETIFTEIGRVLKAGGRYLCVSLAQQHILRKVMEYFPADWFVRVHKVEKASASGTMSERWYLPVFLFVFTKKAVSNMPQVLEVCLHGEEERPRRVSSVQEVITAVQESQQLAMIWHRLRDIHPGEMVHFDLFTSAGTGQESSQLPAEPRYGLYVVDCSSGRKKKGHFAVFIVPQGRELEWMFNSTHGRLTLAENAGFSRLVIVTLHRGHEYGTIQDVKNELSHRIMELAPSDVAAKGRVPFLSTGDDVGHRTVRCSGSSSFSGPYVIEDFVALGGQWHRRLIFLSNRNVVQSEAKLLPPPSSALNPSSASSGGSAMPSKGKKKNKKAKSKTAQTQSPAASPTSSAEAVSSTSVSNGATALSTNNVATVSSASSAKSDTKNLATRCGGYGDIDVSFLACEHHKAMVCSLAVVRGLAEAEVGSQRVMVVGLGGGGLATFLHHHLPMLHLDIVELDPVMPEIAHDWFGFQGNDRMTVNVRDGLDYVRSLAKQEPRPQYEAIMFDVDGKDVSLGMSCPPPAFVEKSFLELVRSLLQPHGVFILNLVCRDPELQVKVQADVFATFESATCLEIADEVNRIVIGLGQPLPCMYRTPGVHMSVMDWLQESAKALQAIVESQVTENSKENVGFVTKLFTRLKSIGQSDL